MHVWTMRCTSRHLGLKTTTIPVRNGPFSDGNAVTVTEALAAVRRWGEYNNAWDYELIIPESYHRPVARTILKDEETNDRPEASLYSPRDIHG